MAGYCVLNQGAVLRIAAPDVGTCHLCETYPTNSVCDADGRCKCVKPAVLHGTLVCGNVATSISLAKSMSSCPSAIHT